ncbi:D-alanyl-D-alanine carboxypeptidase family protein [Microbacterium sp. No. 7]|uniref:D-alanyl-D-alanine carboxypeptidase family protein n=1 Tax=Microbacterium sp. No. 7 TaxID=1714373 RepID=UPI0006D18426|nr:hypothetical protein [Microbacterium sp. No. 7]ALJ21708.1 hypothetical protein AOA12_18145 [Microbacterium sp. No. 7]
MTPRDGSGGTPQRVALGWVDEDHVAAPAAPGGEYAYRRVVPDLLAQRPRRRRGRRALIPLAAVVGVAAVYTASALLWPLPQPTVAPVPVADVTAPATAVAWPAEGAAAVGVEGFAGTPASSGDVAPMASVTKLVTVLMVLEREPLAPGEPGPAFDFTWDDSDEYWEFLGRDESALDVPAEGSLSLYQMLQGVLIGSAGNYTERLARTYWPGEGEFAAAASDWLARQGLTGIAVVEPTGIDEANAGDAASLVALSRLAMAHPVVAEIVRMPWAELPGAGEFENTNELLAADPSIVGIKTGSLDWEFTLTAAKEFTVGAVRLLAYASVVAQPDSDERFSETARLLDEVARETTAHGVAAGTRVGAVTTVWGAQSDLVTAADAAVVLWNGATVSPDVTLDLGDARQKDAEVGTLSLAGPVDAATTPVHLAADLTDPDAWWRLTHPLQLWGLAAR